MKIQIGARDWGEQLNDSLEFLNQRITRLEKRIDRLLVLSFGLMWAIIIFVITSR